MHRRNSRDHQRVCRAKWHGGNMGYKYGVGQDVYYSPPVRHGAAPGSYKILVGCRSRAKVVSPIASRAPSRRSSGRQTRSSCRRSKPTDTAPTDAARGWHGCIDGSAHPLAAHQRRDDDAAPRARAAVAARAVLLKLPQRSRWVFSIFSALARRSKPPGECRNG